MIPNVIDAFFGKYIATIFFNVCKTRQIGVFFGNAEANLQNALTFLLLGTVHSYFQTLQVLS